MILKFLFVFLGTLSLGLGIVGILIPGLPTTPFLLLTAALYIRASPSLHQKLINHKYLGAPLRNYEKNKGITKRGFYISLVMMWSMILLSVLFFIHNPWIRLILILAGMAGTITLMRFPKAQTKLKTGNGNKFPRNPDLVIDRFRDNQNL